LTPEEFRRHLKKRMSGAPGADGWKPEELASFPQDTWRTFLGLWEDWCTRKVFPDNLQHSKQVFLPKEEVLSDVTPVDKLRPICIQPVLCRVLASCMAERAQAWILAKVSADTHGALKGRGVEAGVLSLDAALSRDDILMSLDAYKCFDFMSPELSVGLLEHEGMHPQWAQHLSHMWGCQHRWLQFSGATDACPSVVSNSVPQGCAMAPMALVCMLLEATRAVQASAAGAKLQQSVFVDDRTLVASDPTVALGAWTCWGQWCGRLGLKENLKKLAVVCRVPWKRRVLVQGGIPVRSFTDSTRVLGVDFDVGEAGLGVPTHDARVVKAERVLQRLARAPLGARLKRLLFRTRASPLLAWGVWFHSDNKKEDAKLTTRIKRLLGRVTTMGSRDLWMLLEGPWVSSCFAAGTSAVAGLVRAREYWITRGVVLPGARWQKRVDKFLTASDFQQALPGQWVHPGVGVIDITGAQPRAQLGRALHLLREAYRLRPLLRCMRVHARMDVRCSMVVLLVRLCLAPLRMEPPWLDVLGVIVSRFLRGTTSAGSARTFPTAALVYRNTLSGADLDGLVVREI
ncbi:Pol, partial [Symbiodinium necroappetens]